MIGLRLNRGGGKGIAPMTSYISSLIMSFFKGESENERSEKEGCENVIFSYENHLLTVTSLSTQSTLGDC